jgi:DNA (cytosine-5)-methyltransferase 1
MGQPIESGLEGHAGDGDGGEEPGRVHAQEGGSTAETGATRRMGDASNGRLPRESRGRPGQEPQNRRSDGSTRKQEWSRPWDRFDILPCRDGKARRVESGTFPLAHGVPGRVGRLRAYGNAISPQVGAAFIKAFLAVDEPLTPPGGRL